MKFFRLVGIGLLTFLLSFFAFFSLLEIYKHSSDAKVFGVQESYDLVIKNARIIDGSGGDVFQADIGIKDKIIMKIDKRINTKGAKILNATGYTVAPNKVAWSDNLDGVKHSLVSAIGRYPDYRIIVAEAQSADWCGQSVQALLSSKNVTREMLINDKSALAIIAPQIAKIEGDDISQAFYQLSGWRGELLGEDKGKIKEGYLAQLVVYNHREINDERLLSYLKQEKLPPIQYIIDGSEIQSTNIDS
ncbi:MAG: hypothetical protein ACOYJ1_03935 [Peptococcales bacterium]|jgi:hypothetical protein